MAGRNSTPSDFYVYLHRRATDGSVFYVGKGSGRRAWEQRKRNRHWINISSKNGYTVEIVQDKMCEWWAFELEHDLILFYGQENLCNMTTGGEGASGAKRSDATRKKLSDAKKKSSAPNPMLGKTHTQLSKAKQSKAKIGMYQGEKHPRCLTSIKDVFLVRELRSGTKMTCKAISIATGVSYHVVRNIVYKKSWNYTNENA